MVALREDELRFAGHDRDELRALLVVPEDDNGDGLPGVVVAHEVYGLDAHMRSFARRLAAAGFATLVPDLYSRDGLPGPASTAAAPAPEWEHDAIVSAAASVPDRRAAGDLDAAAARLGQVDGVDARSVAIVGFCMGGTFAFLTACTSRRIAAVVEFYGGIVYPELSSARPVQPLELLLNLDRPYLAFFGEDDPWIPGADVELLRGALAQAAKDAEVVTYADTGHGFFNDARPNHHAANAADAWERMLAFLRASL